MEPLLKVKSTSTACDDDESVPDAPEDSSISESSQDNSCFVPKDMYNPFGPGIGEIKAVSLCDLNNARGVLWIATLGLCFRRSFLGIEIDRKVINWDSVQSISEDSELVKIVTSTGELLQLKEFEYSVAEMANILRITGGKKASVKGLSNMSNEESLERTWSMLRDTKTLDIVVTVSAQNYGQFPLPFFL